MKLIYMLTNQLFKLLLRCDITYTLDFQWQAFCCTRTCVWISSIEVPRTVLVFQAVFLYCYVYSLPKLPSQCYSNGPGKFGNLGSNKDIYILNSDNCLPLSAPSVCTAHKVSFIVSVCNVQRSNCVWCDSK